MRLFLATMALIIALPAAAQTFIEGQHYSRIDPPQPTQSGDKIEVVEVFLYTCPSCNRLAPLIADWKTRKADDVAFQAVPAGWDAGSEAFARAHYAAEVLGVLDRAHRALFDAIHRDGTKFQSAEQLAAWFTQFGVDIGDMNKAMTSFAVNNKIANAAARIPRWGVGGVPTIIVNGKYRFDPTQTGGHAQVIELIDHLVAQERGD